MQPNPSRTRPGSPLYQQALWAQTLQEPEGGSMYASQPGSARPVDLQEIHQRGLQALNRLIQAAVQPDQEGQLITELLLGLNDSRRFTYDAGRLCELDTPAFCDWMAVLAMDHVPGRRIQDYVPNGAEVFRSLVDALKSRLQTLQVFQGHQRAAPAGQPAPAKCRNATH